MARIFAVLSIVVALVVASTLALAGPSTVAQQKAPPFQLPASTGGAGSSIAVYGGGYAAPSGVQPMPFGGGQKYVIPRDATIQGMRVLVLSNSFNAPAEVELHVDGVPVLTITIAPTDGPGTVLATSDVAPVLAGQVVGAVIDTTAATTGFLSISMSHEIL